MESISIIIIIVFCQCCVTDSATYFSKITAKFNEITNQVISAFKLVANKIKMAVFPDNKSEKNTKELDYDKNKVIRLQKIDMNAENNKRVPVSRYLRSGKTAIMSTPQLAMTQGQKIESHIVLTKDGYLLTLHHLRSSFEDYENFDIIPNCTVLLHHGLLGSSADWILLGPEKSLPYLLAQRSCDVWLANARGNYYSRGHILKKVATKDFWNFSWTEMGEYDLPAVVDYIRKVKNSTEPINFIGHSMGATVFLAMLSIAPQYNPYFKIGILLAPLAYLVNTDSPLRLLASVSNNPPEHLISALGDGEFMPNREVPFWIAERYCKGPEIFCINPLLLITGSIPSEESWDKSLATRILSHVPAGGSTNTILHYAQMMRSGKFQKFQDDTQEFSLEAVKVPIIIFSSNEDLFAPVSDALRLLLSIPCPVDHYMIREKEFRHTDLIWSPVADALVFEKVIEYLGKELTCNNILSNSV